ncbi:MAG: hypothetical protein JO166_01810 [Deltaproteobacteria bacterium]|nr:hypothetical protein [Deltaproteobacteria bacterium]
MAIGDCLTMIEIRNAIGTRIASFDGPSSIDMYFGGGLEEGQTGVLVTGRSVGTVVKDTDEAAPANFGPPIGIELDASTVGNVVEDNAAFDELVDQHPNCRGDHWSNNSFASANQGCIH